MLTSAILGAVLASQAVPAILIPVRRASSPIVLAESRVMISPAGGGGAQSPTIDIRVSAGSTVLWQGPLRVGRSGARVNYSKSEAQSDNCPTGDSHDRSTTHAVNINLYRRGDDPAQLTLSADWLRPGAPNGCGNEGTRTVQLSQSVTLAPGQSVTLHGDAGLTVSLRRRD